MHHLEALVVRVLIGAIVAVRAEPGRALVHLDGEGADLVAHLKQVPFRSTARRRVLGAGGGGGGGVLCVVRPHLGVRCHRRRVDELAALLVVIVGRRRRRRFFDLERNICAFT